MKKRGEHSFIDSVFFLFELLCPPQKYKGASMYYKVEELVKKQLIKHSNKDVINRLTANIHFMMRKSCFISDNVTADRRL